MNELLAALHDTRERSRAEYRLMDSARRKAAELDREIENLLARIFSDPANCVAGKVLRFTHRGETFEARVEPDVWKGEVQGYRLGAFVAV